MVAGEACEGCAGAEFALLLGGEESWSEGHTPVIIGEEGDEALLGVVTLEFLGLVLNPFRRTLQPVRMMLV